jgi:hypothetical protein
MKTNGLIATFQPSPTVLIKVQGQNFRLSLLDASTLASEIAKALVGFQQTVDAWHAEAGANVARVTAALHAEPDAYDARPMRGPINETYPPQAPEAKEAVQ